MRVDKFVEGKKVVILFNIQDKQYTFEMKQGRASKKEVRKAIKEFLERNSNDRTLRARE